MMSASSGLVLGGVAQTIGVNVTSNVFKLTPKLAGASFGLVSGAGTIATDGTIDLTAGLAAGASITLQVKEVSGALEVRYPVTLTGARSAPAAPTIAVTKGNAKNTITLTDGAANGSPIDARRLYRSLVANFTADSETLVGSVTFPYEDAPLTNGVPVYYRAAAHNDVGWSAPSAQASGTPSVPVAPTITPNPLQPPQTYSTGTTMPVQDTGSQAHFIKYQYRGADVDRTYRIAMSADGQLGIQVALRSLVAWQVRLVIGGVVQNSDVIFASFSRSMTTSDMIEARINVDGSIGLYSGEEQIVPNILTKATIATAFANSGVSNWVPGTYVSYIQGNFSSVPTTVTYGPISTPISLLDSAVGYKGLVSVDLTYAGSPGGVEMAVLDPSNGNAVVLPYTTATVVSNAQPGRATVAVQMADVDAKRGKRYSVIARHQADPTKVSGTRSIDIVPKLTVGVNDGGNGFWKEYGKAGRWLANAGAQSYTIYGRDEVFRKSEEPGRLQLRASADGAGESIKRDRDGRLYATNGVALTGITFVVDVFSPPESGTYKIELAPGVVLDGPPLAPLTNWAYNSTTGIGTADFVAGVNSQISLKLVLSSIPAGGILPKVYSAALSAAPGRRETMAISGINTKAVADYIRILDVAEINNYRHPTRTTTSIGGRTLANRSLGGRVDMFEDYVARCNSMPGGGGLWFQATLVDSDDYITGAANYIRDNLTNTSMPVLVELSNEFFNLIFDQQEDAMVEGMRLGFDDESKTLASQCTPKTVKYGDGNYTNGKFDPIMRQWTTGDPEPKGPTLLKPLNDGDYIFFKWRLYRVVGNQPAGTYLPYDGNSAFINVYASQGKDATATCYLAGRRWLMYRSKQIKALFQASFASTGRQVKLVLGGQQGDWSGFKAMLDFDNGHQFADIIAPAGYYGHNAMNWEDETLVGWQKADKNVLFGADRTASINAFLDKFFTISAPVELAKGFTSVRQVSDALKAYLVGKGLGPFAIQVALYEYNQHFTGMKYPGTAGVELINGLTSAECLSRMQEAWTKLFFSQRHYDNLRTMTDTYAGLIGGFQTIYSRFGGSPNPGGSWNLQKDETDTDVSGGPNTNWQLKAFRDFKADFAP